MMHLISFNYSLIFKKKQVKVESFSYGKFLLKNKKAAKKERKEAIKRFYNTTRK